jgi:hypothetical protein
MCVISGNLTSFLWKIFFDYLEEKQIPAEAAHNYLRAITENLILSKDPVTGPFQRNDPKVIAEHKKALKGHPIGEIYTAFESSFREVNRENTVEVD